MGVLCSVLEFLRGRTSPVSKGNFKVDEVTFLGFHAFGDLFVVCLLLTVRLFGALSLVQILVLFGRCIFIDLPLTRHITVVMAVLSFRAELTISAN